jgi:hypothetical protein
MNNVKAFGLMAPLTGLFAAVGWRHRQKQRGIDRPAR